MPEAVLALPTLEAAPGDTDRTPLHVVSFALQATDAKATAIDGGFRLLICREGGDRLFDGSRALALLAAHPNPMNGSTEIVYEIDEAAPVSVNVYDRLGRLAATLFEARGSLADTVCTSTQQPLPQASTPSRSVAVRVWSRGLLSS